MKVLIISLRKYYGLRILKGIDFIKLLAPKVNCVTKCTSMLKDERRYSVFKTLHYQLHKAMFENKNMAIQILISS